MFLASKVIQETKKNFFLTYYWTSLNHSASLYFDNKVNILYCSCRHAPRSAKNSFVYQSCRRSPVWVLVYRLVSLLVTFLTGSQNAALCRWCFSLLQLTVTFRPRWKGLYIGVSMPKAEWGKGFELQNGGCIYQLGTSCWPMWRSSSVVLLMSVSKMENKFNGWIGVSRNPINLCSHSHLG